MQKKMICMLLILLALGAPVTAAAEEKGSAWGTAADREAVVYMLGAEPSADLTAQVGTSSVEIKSVQTAAERPVPLQTTVLIDNSISIPEDKRGEIAAILQDVVDTKLPDETVSVATMAGTVTYLATDLTDKEGILAALSAIQYQDQATRLTDCLYSVLAALKEQEPAVLQRIVLVSDGVDNPEIGFTRGELKELIEELGYPVYTVGVPNNTPNSNEQMQELFALARASGGEAFLLDETADRKTIVDEMDRWHDAAVVTVDLPAELCDGTDRMIRVVAEAADGSQTEYVVKITMPFSTVGPAQTDTPQTAGQDPEQDPEKDTAEETPEETPAETPAPEEEAPEEKKEGAGPVSMTTVAGIALLAAAVLVLVLRTLRKGKGGRQDKRKSKAPEAAPPGFDSENTVFAGSEDGATILAAEEQASAGYIVLTDTAAPEHQFVMPAATRIVIGRDPQICNVVIDYDGSVARHQCDILTNGQLVLIMNFSATNITQVNGQPVTQECALYTGSILTMGRVQMQVDFHFDRDQAAGQQSDMMW